MKKTVFLCIACLTILFAVASTGCMTYGPTLGIASIPIPVSPYLQGGYEDQAWEKERYKRVAILDPIEGECIAMDPPSDDQVVRQLEKIRPVSGAVPGLEVTYRNIKGITKEKIADFIDPPRQFPLAGPCQLHHAHYKCTVFFEEVTNVGWPIPHTVKNQDAVEVFYIDLDHLHRVGGGQVDAPLM